MGTVSLPSPRRGATIFRPKPSGRRWLTGAVVGCRRRRLPACLPWMQAYGLPHIAAPFSETTPDRKQKSMVQPHGGPARPALYGGRDSLRVHPAIAPHRIADGPFPAATWSSHAPCWLAFTSRSLARQADARHPTPSSSWCGSGPPKRGFPSKARKTTPSKAPGAPQVRPPATPSKAPGIPLRAFGARPSSP